MPESVHMPQQPRYTTHLGAGHASSAAVCRSSGLQHAFSLSLRPLLKRCERNWNRFVLRKLPQSCHTHQYMTRVKLSIPQGTHEIKILKSFPTIYAKKKRDSIAYTRTHSQAPRSSPISSSIFFGGGTRREEFAAALSAGWCKHKANPKH